MKAKPLTEKDIRTDLFELTHQSGRTEYIVNLKDVLSALRLFKEKIKESCQTEAIGKLALYDDEIFNILDECFQLKEVEE